MGKTTDSQRRRLLAAVSVLGVSLGMAEQAVAAVNDFLTLTPQSSQKGQSSTKTWGQNSTKTQNSGKFQTGQHSQKLGPNSGQNSAKTPPPNVMFDLNQQKAD